MKNYTISNEKITVVISTLGAEPKSIKSCDGIEYMWQGDEKYWKKQGPTLFPYIGRLYKGIYTYKGDTYAFPIHGFAPTSEFEVTDHTDTSVTMVLKSSKETLAIYPFNFEFSVIYAVTDNTLTIEYVVKNLSDKTMYFGVGGHPGINVPLEDSLKFEDYCLEFESGHLPRRIVFSENKFVDGDAPYTLNDKNQIPLTHPLFDDDAVVLTNAGHRVTLKSDKGTHGVEAYYPDMDYIGFWQADHTDATYVCIEPWSSLPSNEGSVTVLDKQDNLISLGSNKTYKNSWLLRLF